MLLEWCCSGRSAWGEVVCGCGGGRVAVERGEPCPFGCEPLGAPDPPVPFADPYYW